MSLDRREFLKASAAMAASLSWVSGCAVLATGSRDGGPGSFRHGVSSGDPLTDRVILWTRVTPEAGSLGPVPVSWRVSRDPGLRDVVSRGELEADAERDFTVKVDAAGLDPGETWYYAFEAEGAVSPLGRTRTLPIGSPERLRLAFCSCSSLPWGYFNAYAELARRADLDAVLHLGDYLYEYANGTYGDGTRLGRIPEPDAELVSLADYRARHAQYKADPDSQAMHRQHPLIAVWDDHELANDAWWGGAQNHRAEQGDWPARRSAAVRAYFEWMPVRERWKDERPVIYRDFRFGDLLELLMLDTRLVGRDPQAARGDRAAIDDPRRTLLGADQERWVEEKLAASQRAGVAWRVVAQQVLLTPVRRTDGDIMSTDKWDGYPAARGRFLDALTRHGVEDTVFLSGDLHSSWALELPRDPFGPSYDPTTGRGSLGVEFVAPGISAPGILDPKRSAQVSADLLESNPHLRWVDFLNRGYAVLDVDRERAQCEWYHVDTVRERRLGERFAKAYRTGRGRSRLAEVDAPSAPPEAPPLA